MSLPAPLAPFGATVNRLGDALINKIIDAVFNLDNPFRSTTVYIYNHTYTKYFFLNAVPSFSSGGMSPGAHPTPIEPRTINGYSVESSGLGTGVTGADLRWGLYPGDPFYALQIVTSNPTIGAAWGTASGFGGLIVPPIIVSVGNNNEAHVDLYWPGA